MQLCGLGTEVLPHRIGALEKIKINKDKTMNI